MNGLSAIFWLWAVTPESGWSSWATFPDRLPLVGVTAMVIYLMKLLVSERNRSERRVRQCEEEARVEKVALVAEHRADKAEMAEQHARERASDLAYITQLRSTVEKLSKDNERLRRRVDGSGHPS